MQLPYHRFLHQTLLKYFLLTFLFFHVITIHKIYQHKKSPSSLSHTTTQDNNKPEAIKTLIESKFSQIEEFTVEQQIKSQNVALSV